MGITYHKRFPSLKIKHILNRRIILLIVLKLLDNGVKVIGKTDVICRFDHVKQKIQITKESVFNLNIMFDMVKPTKDYGMYPLLGDMYRSTKYSIF